MPGCEIQPDCVNGSGRRLAGDLGAGHAAVSREQIRGARKLDWLRFVKKRLSISESKATFLLTHASAYEDAPRVRYRSRR